MNNILSKSFFRWVEGASLVLFLLALSYAWWFLRVRTPPSRIAVEVPSATEENVGAELVNKPMALDDLNKILSQRDIFSRNLPQAPAKDASVVDGGKLPAQFRVVGFLLDGDPQVVIEDTASRQTLFVGRMPGPSGMKIEQIDANRVYLSYQGKNYTINIKD